MCTVTLYEIIELPLSSNKSSTHGPGARPRWIMLKNQAIVLCSYASY